MLDIISMATLIIVFSSFAVFMMLIIIGGNMNKSEEEQRYEDEEQIKYLREYRKTKNMEVAIWKKNYTLGNKLKLIVL